jgi:hypothetical protein
VKCIECANWTPKQGDPKLAKLGLAPCNVRSPGKWKMFGATYERDCEQHRQAVPIVVEKRMEWLNAPSR